MNTENLSKEQRILRAMRKVLGNIVKDTSNRPGIPSSLSENTIMDIRDCFCIIAEREAELANESGLVQNDKPYYPDSVKN
jgi:hypothetical protein